MSFLKLESECTDAGTTGVNCLDTSFTDAKTTHDVNFYKDVIKRLQEELAKIKTENVQLRETVLACSTKLPQVSRKLNTLVACLEAKSYKFSRRKKRRSNDEAEESHSSGECSLDGADDGDCALQDEASEEEPSQTVGMATGDRVHHSVQNFVEIICEEDNSVENGNSRNGEVNNAAVGNSKLADKEKKDNSLENNTKPSAANTITTSRNVKLRKFQGTKQQKEVTIKKNVRHKKSCVPDANEERVQEFSATSKEDKTVPEPVPEELQDDGMDIKIKMEESLEDRPMLENDAQVMGKISKLQKQPQESVISVTSNQAATGTTENTNNDTTDLRKRGRRRAYDCEVCGRTFARSSNLAHHVMRHRNERPHQCEICDRAFVQKANLKVHLRSHTGERPFSCNECGRAFAQKNNALRHLRAHARQRQLQEQKLVCPVCGKAFGRWPSYETHMRRAHSNVEPHSIVPITHCIVEGMVNDSHPTDAPSGVGDISGAPPHPGANIPHHVGNTITNSQLPMENVHPSTVTLVNVHANDNINNSHMPPGHHTQNDHLLVGSHTSITAQLTGAHSCSESAC